MTPAGDFGTSYTDTNTWFGIALRVKSAIKLGIKATEGFARSPIITLSHATSGNGTVIVSFDAASYSTSGIKIKLSLLSSDGSSVLSGPVSFDVQQLDTNQSDLSHYSTDPSGTPLTYSFQNVPSAFRIQFDRDTDGRVCLDSIVVKEQYEEDSGLPALNSPKNLSASNVEYTGFTLSWDSVTDATGYVIVVKNASAVTIATTEVLGTTTTVTGLAAGGAYTAYVVARGDGTTNDDSVPASLENIQTPAYPPTNVPDPAATGVSPNAFTVSWTQHAEETYAVRAWTLVPADVASEDFAGYAATGSVPDGWYFENSRDPFNTSAYSQNPVDFKASGNWIASPEFGGIVSSVSFRVRSTGKFTGSFTVYGTTGSTNRSDWVAIQSWEKEDDTLASDTHTLTSLNENGFTRLVFAFEKSAGTGNIAFGSFSVTGTGVGKAPSYLEGYGSAATSVNTTSLTFSSPVAGKIHYVEVTATGPSGSTETAIISVPVPARSAVISVK